MKIPDEPAGPWTSVAQVARFALLATPVVVARGVRGRLAQEAM